MSIQEKVRQNLDGKTENYIFPFFWQHGEEEAVLREYMKAICEANIRAVCVESRPHPDFAGPLWWRDMDIILDEAVRRNMKVWILDDMHFPTGYAAGALAKAPMELSHQYLDYNTVELCGPVPMAEVDVASYAKPQPIPPWMPQEADQFEKKHDDHLFRVLACPVLEQGLEGETTDLTSQVKDGKLYWNVPEGYWRLYIIYLTRDAGGRNDYINFLDKDSCRLLIDAVYEPHYRRYGQYFGNVIAGFFSDEPPIGNTAGYTAGNLIGSRDMALSWSGRMEDAMDREYGEPTWRDHLNCLWEKSKDRHLTARMRTAYMNAVTKLEAECFSEQIGDWCHKHGVEYIGHMVEECDTSAELGASMGHFFRGLSGQHMAGIDDIGSQVKAGGQDVPRHMPYTCQDEPGFFHYMLGRMGASMGAVDPKKQGRCLCEIFGAYGWRLGVRQEKYLADHFLARGVNRFVPHAFSPKEFPDWDCPPHFYAHGNNPQYRAFGKLMSYMNRVCHLTDRSLDQSAVALLYNGESQWAGEFESNVSACRAMTEHQIGFALIPADVFEDRDYFGTHYDREKNILTVNHMQFHTLVISGCSYLTRPAAEFLLEAAENDFPVIFTGFLPEGISDVKEEESREYMRRIRSFPCVPAKNLPDKLTGFPQRTVLTEEPDRYLTAYRFENGGAAYFLLNENPGQCFDQWITIPKTDELARYDAWENQLFPAETRSCDKQTQVHVRLEPLEMMILIEMPLPKKKDADTAFVFDAAGSLELTDFTVSRCEAQSYPYFEDPEPADTVHGMAFKHPDFSGYYRYEQKIQANDWKNVYLSIENVYETAEVFVNGISAGTRIAPPYRFSLGDLDGDITIAIETATTLERKMHAAGVEVSGAGCPSPLMPTGILGKTEITYWK